MYKTLGIIDADLTPISNFKFPGDRLLGFFICQTTAHKISLEMKELFFLDFKWHDTAVLPVKNSPRRVI